MKRLAVAVLLTALASESAYSSDWGYDEEKPPIKPLRAQAQSLLQAKPLAKPGAAPVKTGKASGVPTKQAATATRSSAARPSASRSQVASGALPASDKAAVAAESWRMLYELARGELLSSQTRKSITDTVEKEVRAGSADGSFFSAVASNWSPIVSYLEKHPEQRENYSFLLKSLLRSRARMAAASGKPTTDVVLTGEVLGPIRIAVDGQPPLSEEAVDAYSDMACFLYEQKNPGKTVDAIDNRTMFAHVVSEKFRNAPSAADKLAMANFDIAWAKFKILWIAGSPEQKQQLLSRLEKTGTSSATQQVKDATLEALLKAWSTAQAPVASTAAATQSN